MISRGGPTIAARIAVGVILIASVRPTIGPTARWAAPQVIVFGGGPLRQRVVLNDWSENQRLMLAAGRVVRVPADSFRNRPRISVAMYWGSQWKDRTDLPDSVSIFSTLDGAQSGAFYPRVKGQPGLWVFGPAAASPGSTRILEREGMAILAKHGVPVDIK